MHTSNVDIEFANNIAAMRNPSNLFPLLKPLFHSSQKPTRKLAASAFKYCGWMKVLAASLRVGFRNEWKRGFTVCVLLLPI